MQGDKADRGAGYQLITGSPSALPETIGCCLYSDAVFKDEDIVIFLLAVRVAILLKPQAEFTVHVPRDRAVLRISAEWKYAGWLPGTDHPETGVQRRLSR